MKPITSHTGSMVTILVLVFGSIGIAAEPISKSLSE